MYAYCASASYSRGQTESGETRRIFTTVLEGDEKMSKAFFSAVDDNFWKKVSQIPVHPAMR